MNLHPLAGQPVPSQLIIDLKKLEQTYYSSKPDAANPMQLVSFGTSGHRGTSTNATFTETHVLAITQAICEYRKSKSISGPLFLGKDTHALSRPAERTALEVLAANEVTTVFQCGDGFTPTPVISHAIISFNRTHADTPADGIVITPSHNPPDNAGIKYNPPHGGPADTDVTKWIQERANALIREGNRSVKRIAYEQALKAPTTRSDDFVVPYVKDLSSVVDIAAIKQANLKIGVDPLGGSSLAYWQPVAEIFGLNLTVVNTKVDPTFSFMTLDHDGKVRMDCSSPHAMANLVALRNKFDVAFGNDPDADRHGIVTPSSGLMNPNHYLAVAIHHLLRTRTKWSKKAVVGKTLVSSSLIDRVVASLGRTLWEVPVGFKWFAPGLFDGSCCFGGEESAGASFLRLDGSAWTSDKDGLIMGLLAAEIMARSGKDPGAYCADLMSQFGKPHYTRIDTPLSHEQKKSFTKLTPEQIKQAELAGDKILARMTNAPGNNAPIGGIKVTTANGWFAARPSGTEDICKLYAESFKSEAHLQQIVSSAQQILNAVLK
jgi:phosphoglucomutase